MFWPDLKLLPGLRPSFIVNSLYSPPILVSLESSSSDKNKNADAWKFKRHLGSLLTGSGEHILHAACYRTSLKCDLYGFIHLLIPFLSCIVFLNAIPFFTFYISIHISSPCSASYVPSCQAACERLASGTKPGGILDPPKQPPATHVENITQHCLESRCWPNDITQAHSLIFYGAANKLKKRHETGQQTSKRLRGAGTLLFMYKYWAGFIWIWILMFLTDLGGGIHIHYWVEDGHRYPHRDYFSLIFLRCDWWTASHVHAQQPSLTLLFYFLRVSGGTNFILILLHFFFFNALVK